MWRIHLYLFLFEGLHDLKQVQRLRSHRTRRVADHPSPPNTIATSVLDTLRSGFAIGVLLLFVAVGVTHVVDPDRFLRQSGIRKGGEMLTAFNRLQFRFAGAVFACFAICFT
jgi:hypothetical protein